MDIGTMTGRLEAEGEHSNSVQTAMSGVAVRARTAWAQLCSAVLYTVVYSSVLQTALPYNAVQCHIMQFSAVECRGLGLLVQYWAL